MTVSDQPQPAAKREASDTEMQTAIRLTVDADTTVSYASHQNHIPVIHGISVRNEGDVPLHAVELLVEAQPGFAEPLRFRYDALDVGESRHVQPVDMRLLHNYLVQLTEAENGTLTTRLMVGGEVRAETITPISVLAYDQWGGTRSVPELLCAFSQPNHPHVDRIMSEAAALMAAGPGSHVIDGYKSKNREAIWSQISAIYAAVFRRGVEYCIAPASFASSGQKVRQADRIFEGGVANCLDLTMLMSSCLEQAGLNPLLLIKDGHAWIACWLVNTSFATCLTDDVLAVRKRIDAGEMIAIETTAMTHARSSMRLAQEAGYRHFTEKPEEFEYAIDVRRARLEQIHPLPSRGARQLDERAIGARDLDVEAAPILPPLIGSAVLLDEDIPVETPAGRLSRWSAKLLDMTLRNRLLNFKPSKVMIPLQVPDLAALEDALAEGREWKFRALPPIMSGSDPRSREVTRDRHGGDPLLLMAREAMAKQELLVKLEDKQMNSSLNDVYLTVKTGLEESGANTLYVAMGFLRWSEDEKSEKTYLAPILLVPVILKRASVRTGFTLLRHDDETIVNPTLLHALQERHGVQVRGVDPPPMDDNGVNVPKIFAIFREAVKEVKGWEVVEDSYLGIFSFHKFVMYTDLRNRAELLRKSPIVQHLIERPHQSMAHDDIRRRDDLDDVHGPGDFIAPLSADSSQLNALRRVNEGHSFVIKGPPGTGKSQTITNLIADALGKSKRVLFVSEKMAALSVVERRLKDVGVGPFCLQLHSAKAAKAEVHAQLKISLALLQQQDDGAWSLEVERLTRLRSELNALVRAMHAPHSNGLTVYAAIGTAIRHRRWKERPINLVPGRSGDRRDLEQMRELARNMQAVSIQIGGLKDHPLRLIFNHEWSNAWQSRLLSAGDELRGSIRVLTAAAAQLEAPLGLSITGASLDRLQGVDVLAGVLIEAPGIPTGFAQKADVADVRKKVEKMRLHGVERNEIWSRLSPTLKPDVAHLNGVELDDAWKLAAAKWTLPRWLGQRAVRNRLKIYALHGKAPSADHAPTLIENLIRLNLEDLALGHLEVDAAALLEDRYQSTRTDWDAVEGFARWAARLDAGLNRFASLDQPELHGQLTEKVRQLVGPHRKLLAEGAPLSARLIAYRQSYRALQDALALASEAACNPTLAGDGQQMPGALTALNAQAGSWGDLQYQIRDVCLWNGFRAEARAVGLAEVFVEIESGDVPPQSIAEYVEFCYRLWWAKGVIDRDPTLRNFSGAIHDQKIKDFQVTDQRFQELSKKLLYAKLSATVQSSRSRESHRPEIAILSREIQKQRAHIPIRKLVQSMPNMLMALKPCLLMSPLSVAQYLSADFPPFDLVIFDEASQVPVWDAVGVIARGKQTVIAGDPKQLPPSAFFDRADDGDGDGDGTAPPKDLESILDECLSIGMASLSLDWHYRSEHESLIAFSNHRYYESSLITFPSPATLDTSVKLIAVNGVYDRGGQRTNRAEAEAIVKRIIDHFSHADEKVRKQTMGVVTFNATQMKLIDDLLNAELGRHPLIEERMVAHGDERLFIKNLENVQGDERAIILFSTTFGKDAAGRLSLNFGPMNAQGGERRLNVAITRARSQVEIYSSLRPEDIDLSKTRAAGVVDLKAYLNFAMRGPAALAMEAAPTNRDPDSPFEVEVIHAIRQAGWTVHPQVGCSGYRVDIGVVDKTAPGRYLMGVECDGATYHSMASARDRDRLRQVVLENLGWTIARVWSTDWWRNPQRCTRVLLAQIEAAQAARTETASEASPPVKESTLAT